MESVEAVAIYLAKCDPGAVPFSELCHAAQESCRQRAEDRIRSVAADLAQIRGALASMDSDGGTD